MRSRPAFSTRINFALSSCFRCRVVVGQLHSKRVAISPAPMLPPWSFSTKRICRREAWASAAKTSSRSASSLCASRGTKELQALEVRKLHIGSPVPAFRKLVHQFPNRHDIRVLVGDSWCFRCLPAEDLHEYGFAVLLNAAQILRRVNRNQIEGTQGRPVALQQRDELVLMATSNAIEAHYDRSRGHRSSPHLANTLIMRHPRPLRQLDPR